MTGADLTQFLDYTLIAMLLAVGFAIVRLRNLFAVVMLTGVYSLLSAAWFVSLDAVDVAFTEAAVGAGISTVLMLGAMLLTAREADPAGAGRHWAAFAVVAVAGLALLFAIVSSFRDRALPEDLVVFGEVGLSGEIRPVPSGQERLQEAKKHGFSRAIVPKANAPRGDIAMDVVAVSTLAEAIEAM